MEEMFDLTKRQSFTVPLGIGDFRLAQQFSRQLRNPNKARQIFLNTLAVSAVNFYCQCFEIETDLDLSRSWDDNARILIDVADLKIKNRGTLECRPVLPGENICHVPPEVWFDRIGYVIVEINEEAKTATILGFTEKVEAENLPLKQLNSLEEMINLLLIEVISQEDNLQILRAKLEKLFTQEWSEPEKLLASSHRGLITKIPNDYPQNSQPPESEIKVSKAKLIRLKGREFALIVKMTLEGEKLTLTLEVRPIVRTIEDVNILPSGLELALLDKSGKVLKVKQAGNAEDFIRIKCSIKFTNRFMLKVTLEGESCTEKFISD